MNLAVIGSRGFPSTYGGYETLVRHLARWLVAEGHQVTVYCRTRDEGRREWITENVLCVATSGHDSKALSTLSFGASSAAHAARRNYDCALVLNIANGFYLPLLKRSGVPTAVNTDGIEWERGKWGNTARRVFKVGAALTARFADELVADSEAIGGIWERQFGVSSTFIPYGASVIDDRSEVDRLESLGLKPESYLLVVARLIPENNVETALDALDLLGDNSPPAVIVGSANFESPLEARLAKLQDAGKLRWLGHVDDQVMLTQLWSHAGVYFHGHSVGGTNPALIQALGAGAPVVAYDSVFSREIVGHEDQLVPLDPGRLAERVREVLGSESTRDRFRERGQEIVRTRYDWDDVCARYLDVLQRIAR